MFENDLFDIRTIHCQNIHMFIGYIFTIFYVQFLQKLSASITQTFENTTIDITLKTFQIDALPIGSIECQRIPILKRTDSSRSNEIVCLLWRLVHIGKAIDNRETRRFEGEVLWVVFDWLCRFHWKWSPVRWREEKNRKQDFVVGFSSEDWSMDREGNRRFSFYNFHSSINSYFEIDRNNFSVNSLKDHVQCSICSGSSRTSEIYLFLNIVTCYLFSPVCSLIDK